MKILGIDDVNKMLPLIKPITLDIQQIWDIIIEQKISIEQMSECDEKETIKKELSKNIDKINEYIKEIESLDGLVAAFKKGEIHFTSLYHGRKIFLCVLPLVENEVQYWHELDEVFTDRVLIDKHVLKTVTKKEKNNG